MLNCMPYMQMMNLPSQYHPMMEMPQGELESMYPKVYHIIYPHVKHHCDMFYNKYGMMYSPSHEQFETMVDDIHHKVERDVDMDINLSVEAEERQIGFGGRRLLRDLISILLLRQLIDRRLPYGGVYGSYPGSYGGYPLGYGGYPLGYGGY